MNTPPRFSMTSAQAWLHWFSTRRTFPSIQTIPDVMAFAYVSQGLPVFLEDENGIVTDEIAELESLRLSEL